jgi:predicted ferric reductase
MKAKTFNILILLLLGVCIAVWAVTATFGQSLQQNIRPILNLSAIVGMVFLFVQFLLSVRIRFVEDGFGLDKMLYFHRYSGRIAVGAFTLHGGLVFYNQWLRLGGFNLSTYVLIGLLALIALFVTAGLASTYKIMRIPYEAWKNIHLLNYIIFPVALVHVFNYSTPGSFFHYLWIAMALGFIAMLLYRLQRISTVRANVYTVSEVRKEADELWSLFFKGPKVVHKPGQFLILQLIRDGKRSAAHPFTISSAPDADLLSVTIKELGDFTATVGETKPGDKALLDYPYGVFSILNHTATDYCFIAGGIGITPFMSMLRHLYNAGDDRKITLFWGNQSDKYLAFQSELAEIMTKLPSLQIVLVMSHQPEWEGEKGFLNTEMMKRYHTFSENTRFFLCGPPAMTRAVLADLKKANIPVEQIHYEAFEL